VQAQVRLADSDRLVTTPSVEFFVR
jgi:hypothetical protein